VIGLPSVATGSASAGGGPNERRESGTRYLPCEFVVLETENAVENEATGVCEWGRDELSTDGRPCCYSSRPSTVGMRRRVRTSIPRGLVRTFALWEPKSV
jgi:hypothetical protein